MSLELHGFSKNLQTTSQFYVPGGWHEACSIKRTDKYDVPPCKSYYWGTLQLGFVHLCILYRTVWSSNLLCMRNVQNKKSHRCQYSRAQPCNNVITSDTLPLWLQHTLYIYSIAKRPEPCCSVKELNPCLMKNRKQWQYVGAKRGHHH
jgi:hypothetical protein